MKCYMGENLFPFSVQQNLRVSVQKMRITVFHKVLCIAILPYFLNSLHWFKTTFHAFSEGKCEKSEGNWWFRKIQNFVFDLNTIHAYNWNKMILPIKWRFILSIIDSRLLSMYFLRLSVRKVRVIDSKTSIEWIKMLNWVPSELPSYFHF